MSRLLFSALLLLSAVSFARADDFRAYDIEVIFPWARATGPGQSDGAVFMKLSNTGDIADRLLRASSSMAGNARLQPGRAVVISPGETVLLGPGGVHIQLGGLREPLVEGSAIPLTLTFERGGTVEITAEITSADAVAPPGE
ncbi:MAG: copper chaperone PCu(A)C [Rhodospirillaceae bacterium]